MATITEMKEFKAGDWFVEFINQNDRDAVVLAVIDDQILYRYYMEGTVCGTPFSVLRIQRIKGVRDFYKALSYRTVAENKLPKKWRNEVFKNISNPACTVTAADFSGAS